MSQPDTRHDQSATSGINTARIAFLAIVVVLIATGIIALIAAG